MDNVTFKNGNKDFQFSKLDDLSPKRFKIDGHPVRLVYGLVARISVWGTPRGSGEWENPGEDLVIPETQTALLSLPFSSSLQIAGSLSGMVSPIGLMEASFCRNFPV